MDRREEEKKRIKPFSSNVQRSPLRYTYSYIYIYI